jgi:hypothetical protein
MFLWRTEHLHNTGQLLLFVLSRKYGVPSEQLSKNAPQTPHVNSHTIRHAQNDFGGTVETALDVCVDLFILKTTRPKVNDFDLRP